VPSAFVTLDALPLTRNGKLDRKALPAPDLGAGRPTAYVAPRSDAERVLAQIWTDLLKAEQVGVEDNFFELGGDSILTIQVISRVQAALGVAVSPRTVFSNPTVAGLAAVIEEMTGADDAVAGSAIPVLSRDDELPLSFAQQRLWFLDQFEPDSPEYNLTPIALRLRGALDVEALNTALTGLVARQESLRTTFEDRDGRGVQVVHEPFEVRIPILDLSGWPEAEREAKLDRVLAEEAATPFDLRRGPLVRPRLVRLAPAEHAFTLNHHIVTDGWSTGVIERELGALYRAALRDEAAELSPLAVQYADVAAWQRNRLSGPVVEEHLEYWKRQLANVATLELPTDRLRPAVRTTAGAAHEFQAASDVTARLKELARSHDSTLFMTLIAACQVLFHRWSGQHDIAVGTVTSGRERVEMEGLVGFFVNTVVLRSQVDRDCTVGQFLEEVRGTVLDAFAHQDVPFEKVVDEVQPNRDTSRTPLFQAMVVLQNTPGETMELPGLEAEDLVVPRGTTSFDLTINFEELGDVLTGVLQYNVDLFDAATIERMAQHLTMLLESIAADPNCRLAALPMLGEIERHRLLVEWNDTGRVVPEATLIELLQAQVARTPQALAVVSRV